MSLKFERNRSVSEGYCKIPMYYTGITHPRNKNKELVLMDQIGKTFTACWRNNKLDKTGIEFEVPVFKGKGQKGYGFIFKDKKYYLKDCNRVL